MSRKSRKLRNPIEEIVSPTHVSRRCGAKARSTGQPCRRWASIGSARCRFHGGAPGSGRPAIHGRRGVQARRGRQLLRLTKYLLKRRAVKPDPV